MKACRSAVSTILRLILAGTACLIVCSCATRVVCDRKAPKLHRQGGEVSDKADEKARIARYVLGETAADGFTVEGIEKIYVMPVCGMGLMGSVATLGLVPVELSHPVYVTVVGRLGNARKTRTYHVALSTRTSVWHQLRPKSSDDRAVARSLLEALKSDPCGTVPLLAEIGS